MDKRPARGQDHLTMVAAHDIPNPTYPHPDSWAYPESWAYLESSPTSPK